VTPDVVLEILQAAVLFAVVDVWTITHSFGAGLVPGVQEKVLALAAPPRAEICSTRVAFVQFQPDPGQFGPA
jgi:hypothetical protein